MEVSGSLKKLYDTYYEDEKVLIKRKIAARQTVDHINLILPRRSYRSIIDIGAGDGAVLQEINRLNICHELHAVEISESGCASIKDKKIPNLCTVCIFDGYKIPLTSNRYELGLATHVLEHVEHERAFIKELSQTCDFVYIEVPLELTFNLTRNIRVSTKYGHINYYNISTFNNLLGSCGLKVLSTKLFTASMEYEIFLSGNFKGKIKYYVKKIALIAFPRIAPFFFTYMGGAYCSVAT